MFSNAHQSVPALFKEIMANQEQRRALKTVPVVDFARYKTLYQDMVRFRKAAEDFLRRTGNTNGKI